MIRTSLAGANISGATFKRATGLSSNQLAAACIFNGMREPVPFLDTKAMDWTQSGLPGIYSILLSRDPETGERKALNRLVPADGMKPPGAAHYHHTTEELLIVKGRMSFDGKVWLTPQSYCFHPPETVHGIKSAVPEES